MDRPAWWDEPSAWLAESSDPDDFLLASGRFAAHIELGDELGEEIEDASLEEALQWARERSDVVLIRLWDTDYYSAGSRNPDPDQFPPWPEAGPPVERRRPRGFEMLDNGPDAPPVPWLAIFHAPGTPDADLLVAVLAHPRASPVPPEVDDPRAAGAKVLVHASTLRGAEEIAEEIWAAIVEPLVRPLALRTVPLGAVYPIRVGHDGP